MTRLAWTVTVEKEVTFDLAAIRDHLARSYIRFGEDLEVAHGRAIARARQVRSAADRIAIAPFRGTAHDNLLPGLRHLTIDGMVYWFVTDEAAQTIRVLAIFFGAQDHRRRMLIRLLGRYRD